MQISKIKTIYFVGIKGVAMTALACYAKERGFMVSGSDVVEAFPTDELLARENIRIDQGFSEKNITPSIDLAVYTGAHNGIENIEVQKAQSLGITIMSHAQALGLFTQEKKTIAVCGSHGKTTTSALIASLFSHAGKDPSYAIGCGGITDLQTSGHFGHGEEFIVEADEYVTDPLHDLRARFLWLNPQTIIVTNIDFDHPDIYPDIAAVAHVFTEFVSQMKKDGVLILNYDDEYARSLIQKTSASIITYGKTEAADYSYRLLSSQNGKTLFSINHQGKLLGEFSLSIPGIHNIGNATAAIISSIQQGISVERIKKNLPLFLGTKRRFEKHFESQDLVIIDDYAHHPAEIKATIAAAKEWYPNYSLTVVFQPHTYSRTKALMDEFAQSFSLADLTIVTEIYASAREKIDLEVSVEKLTNLITNNGRMALFMPKKASVLEYLKQHKQTPQVILTMGAGDIYAWLPDFVHDLP